MTKRRTINIKDIWDVNIKIYWRDGSFVLEFNNDKYLIRFHLDRFWVKRIAIELWKVIRSERKQVQELEDALKEG